MISETDQNYSSAVYTQGKILGNTQWQEDLPFFETPSSFWKRCFDIIFSSLVLILLSPLYLCVWIGIRFSSPGQAIYCQLRLGKRGKPFKCYKFRTMVPGAEDSLAKILESFPTLKKEWEQKQKLRQDPRVFPFGKLLRKTSLDELPQFWNVLKGDLSVVGPRPYMLNQLTDLGAYATKILSIRPGVTGLWQTSGRSRTTFMERITLDADYTDRQSFWMDMMLIFKTLPIVIFSKDAC